LLNDVLQLHSGVFLCSLFRSTTPSLSATSQGDWSEKVWDEINVTRILTLHQSNQLDLVFNVRSNKISEITEPEILITYDKTQSNITPKICSQQRVLLYGTQTYG